MSEESSTVTRLEGASLERQLAFPRLPEETFKRWLAVLISLVTMLVAISTFLQSQASNRSASLTRKSQDAAIRATGEQTRGQEHYGYDLYGVTSLYDELHTLAVRAGNDKPLSDAYANAGKSLQPLSPLLSNDYSHFDSGGYRSSTDIGRYEAETYVVNVALLSEQRAAYAQESNDWNNKSDNYVAAIAIFAVALFLFGLSSTLAGLMRVMFLVVGIVITGVASLWLLSNVALGVRHIPDDALKQFAQGRGFAVQATDYSAPTAEYLQHAKEYWQKALDAYSAAIKIDPSYGNAYDARGQAYINVDPAQPKEAVADFQRAIASNKREYTTYWNYGFALYLNGDFDKVATPSEEALKLNPQICGPHLNIGLALLAQGKLDDASAEYDKAIKRCDKIYQDAIARGDKAPVSLWDSMQGGVDDLENFLCSLNKTHCFEGRDRVDLTKLQNVSDVVAERAETLRRRLKEALTALEFQGTTVVTPSGAHWDPLTFGYRMVDNNGQFANYAVRNPFPYSSGGEDLELLSTYHGMNSDMNVVWKVFHDGQEAVGLRYADKWNLEKDGPVVKKINSWYVLGPGHYDVEVYANGEMLASGGFDISDKSPTDLKNPLPTNAVPSAPVSVGALTFADNFDNNYANWWTGTAVSEQESTIDGAFTIVTHAQNHSFSASCSECGSFGDFYYEADTRYVSGPTDFGYGLIYRGDSAFTKMYAFDIDADGYYNVSKYDGAWHYLAEWAKSDLINQRGSNKLGVMCRGTTCEFYINGKFVTRVTDSTFSSGEIGVTVGNTDVKAAFDNVRVWNLK
jgi:tetratricopeptide (TPR) repeat protein